MPALQFSRASKIAPDPWKVNHGGPWDIGYTCHMAVMHWAFMALGKNQLAANQIVGMLARRTCPKCLKNTLGHNSINAAKYGEFFCVGAQQIPNRDSLYNMVEVGDVLVTDSPSQPMHSMVVRQKRGRDHITIRGFNNIGTLGTGARDRYDAVSHNITQNKYWHNPATGAFGLGGSRLFCVPHDIFMSRINIAEDMFCAK